MTERPADQELAIVLADLGSDHPDLIAAARRYLDERGEAIVPALLDELRRDSIGGSGRANLLRFLGGVARPETLPALIEASDDPRPIVRSGAIDALAAYPGTGATEALVRILNVADADAVKHAAGALGERRAPAAVSGLAALLDRPEQGVRYVAAGALGAIGGAAAASALAARLPLEADPEVRAAIRTAVEERQ